MDSRFDASKMRELNDKTMAHKHKSAELDSQLTIESTTSSTTFESLDSSVHTQTFQSYREHVEGCASKYRDVCTCDLLKRYRVRQEKRKQWSTRPKSDLTPNDTVNSTILAGNVRSTSEGRSGASSESFHSAESAPHDIEVVYSNIEEKSGIGSNEFTVESLNIAVDESKLRNANHNIDSTTQNNSDAPVGSLSLANTDETSYMTPFLQKICREMGISTVEGNIPDFMEKLSLTNTNDLVQFKERLVTIIEETDLYSHQQKDDKHYPNLSHLSIEFKKKCKYILDESMPAQMLALSCDPSRSILWNPLESKSPLANDVSPSTLHQKSVDFQTPIRASQRETKKIYRKTPKNIKKIEKSNQSPLCLAMLKGSTQAREPAAETSERMSPVGNQTPQRAKPIINFVTPQGLSPNRSFLYWEHYADKHASPMSENKKGDQMIRSVSVPDILSHKFRNDRAKRTAVIQIHSLDDPPPSPATYPEENLSSEGDKSETFDDPVDNNLQLSELILAEVVKKRLRCLETEKTIREIDSALNVSEDSLKQDASMLEYLQTVVGRCSEYHQHLTENRDIIRKSMKTFAEHHTPKANAQTSSKIPEKPVNSTKKVQPVGSGLKRPAFVVNFRRRSPVVVRKSPKTKQTSQSNREEPSLYLCGLSAKKTPARHNTPSLARTPKVVSSSLLSAGEPPPMLNIPRTPVMMNEKALKISSSKSVQSKFPRTTNLALTKSKSIQNIPSVCRTAATPSARVTVSSHGKKTLQSHEKPRLISSKSLQTPVKVCEKPAIVYRSRKVYNTLGTPDAKDSTFFHTPRTTPQKSSVPLTQGKYFNTPVEKKTSSLSKSTVKKTFPGRAAYYSYETVKSPVAEYINSTDAKLVQNIRSKDNAFLLTPKSKQTATSTEALRVKLGRECEVEKNQREAENDENSHNAPIHSYPKVIYQPPATVYDIKYSPSSKLHAGHRTVLREIKDKRVVIRHEGRIHDNLAEHSIHVSKTAEKSNYIANSQQ